MPELESCSRCGKQVLIARYPWNREQVLCQPCSELALATQGVASSSHVKDLEVERGNEFLSKPNFHKEKLQLFTTANTGKHQKEILVTWPSLLKISCGFLLILMIVISIFINWKTGKKRIPLENLPSSEINLFKK